MKLIFKMKREKILPRITNGGIVSIVGMNILETVIGLIFMLGSNIEKCTSKRIIKTPTKSILGNSYCLSKIQFVKY